MSGSQKAEQQKPLILKFAGSLVEQLGAQLYPSVTAAVAELISNAWDADARTVWVTIPFNDWSKSATIEVLDDGNGMAHEEARLQYLIVGRNRRKAPPGETSERGRPLHGRKGIGKLAAFGTAGWLECVTVKSGAVTAFAIDYEKLRRSKPTEDYLTEDVPDPEPIRNPETGSVLRNGTRVRLTHLRAKRRPSEHRFRQSMARRFAINANEMKVLINGVPLARFEQDVEIRFPADGMPLNSTAMVDEEGWAVEDIDYGEDTRTVRWWIGFTKMPIPEEDMRGISVLARGKQAQRPFTFGSSQGTEGQLGQEYLVGEVQADWLDHGVEAEDDLIQSNRDQMQLDNEELQPFLEWGQRLLKWALAERNRQRRDVRVGPGSFGEGIERILEATPRVRQQRLRTLAGRISAVTDERGLETALEAIVEQGEASVVRGAAAALSLSGDPDDAETWEVIHGAEAAAQEVLSGRVESRVSALERFEAAVREPPVEQLHLHVIDAPWVIAPWLELTSRQLVMSDDAVCVVDFDPIPGLTDDLRLVAAHVGGGRAKTFKAALAEQNADRLTWVIADSLPSDREEGWRYLTWKTALAESLGVHRAWLETLNHLGA
jgi:hypothetical protein